MVDIPKTKTPLRVSKLRAPSSLTIPSVTQDTSNIRIAGAVGKSAGTIGAVFQGMHERRMASDLSTAKIDSLGAFTAMNSDFDSRRDYENFGEEYESKVGEIEKEMGGKLTGSALEEYKKYIQRLKISSAADLTRRSLSLQQGDLKSKLSEQLDKIEKSVVDGPSKERMKLLAADAIENSGVALTEQEKEDTRKIMGQRLSKAYAKAFTKSSIAKNGAKEALAYLEDTKNFEGLLESDRKDLIKEARTEVNVAKAKAKEAQVEIEKAGEKELTDAMVNDTLSTDLLKSTKATDKMRRVGESWMKTRGKYTDGVDPFTLTNKNLKFQLDNAILTTPGSLEIEDILAYGGKGLAGDVAVKMAEKLKTAKSGGENEKSETTFRRFFTNVAVDMWDNGSENSKFETHEEYREFYFDTQDEMDRILQRKNLKTWGELRGEMEEFLNPKKDAIEKNFLERTWGKAKVLGVTLPAGAAFAVGKEAFKLLEKQEGEKEIELPEGLPVGSVPAGKTKMDMMRIVHLKVHY